MRYAHADVENDDRSFALVDVLKLAERTGLRVVWDILHHRCHDPERISDRDALAAALATWPPDQTPKIHVSSPRLDVDERRVRVGRRVERRIVLPQLRAHADLIDPIGFEAFLRTAPAGRDFDVMLEAKAKDLALLRLRDQLADRGLPSERGRVLVAAWPASRRRPNLATGARVAPIPRYPVNRCHAGRWLPVTASVARMELGFDIP